MTPELENSIQDLINDRTFSLEAVEKIKALRDKLQKTEEILETNDNLKDTYYKNWNNFQNKHELNLKKLKIWEQAEADLIQREKNITKLECEVKMYRELANAHREDFAAVFKNPITSKTIYDTIPLTMEYSGGGSFVEDHKTTKQTTEEII
jgi:hypothetical protein